MRPFTHTVLSQPLLTLATILFLAGPALADPPPIVSTDAELREAILDAGNGDTITFAADITLSSDLPGVHRSITIDGAGHALDGAGAYRGFFTYSVAGRVAFTVRNLTIRNTKAAGGKGGSSAGKGGGGGGAGLGGAMFVHANVDVTLAAVTFDGNSATGGAGGDDSNPAYGGGTSPSGGGGGLGGAGGSGSGTADAPNGGGGGVGASANGGGENGPAGASIIMPGADGGAASADYTQAAAGGGLGAIGSNGGFGGGGGALRTGNIQALTGGAGGFGGGGGAAYNGGPGGYGGGGGGRFGGANGPGGFGGGAGSLFGGGGLGAGGAIFVMEGGTVTVSGSNSIANGAVAGGSPGVGPGGNGQAGSAFGSGIFFQGANAITFSPAEGETQTISDVIADQTGSGGTGGSAGAAGLTKMGAGTLTLSATNTYTGETNLVDGRTVVNGSLASASAVNIGTAAVLSGSGVINGGASLNGLVEVNTNQLTLGSLTWSASGQLRADLGPGLAPLLVTGALTKSGTGSYVISLTDGGVTPGTTYTLLTFGSNAGFVASDFAVTGVAGNLSLQANALKFTTPVAPFYGVAMNVAKGKARATFTITNTGNTTTSFRIAQGARVSSDRTGPKPPKPPQPEKPAVELVSTLDGANVSKTIATGVVTTIPAGGSATVVVKAKKRRSIVYQRAIRITLTATSQVDPSKAASATVTLKLRATK